MLKRILYGQFREIRRDEWPQALLLSSFFFLVIATFWVLKPLKRGILINYFGDDPLTFLGLTFGGAEAEQIGKSINVVVAYIVVVLFTWLSRVLSRKMLVLVFAAINSVAFVFFATAVDGAGEGIVWAFYVFGDTFNTMMVVLFWAFTNDIMTADQAQRSYGVIGLGGVLGGFVGATFVNAYVEQTGRAELLWYCLAGMAAIVVIAFVVDHLATPPEERGQKKTATSGRADNPVIEGAKLVFTSPYLLAIAGIICLYEVTSNIIDFQLAATVEATITDDLGKDEFFALTGQLIGATSIFVQLFITGAVLQRFGAPIALLVLPVAFLGGSVGFLLVPGLVFAAVMSVSDNGLNYSINQSAKEALYTPTSDDVTYKAKAFIDGFVQRFGKIISVVLNLFFVAVFASGVRWLSLVTLGLLGFWILLVRHAGREFRKLEAAQRGDGPAGRRVAEAEEA